MKVNFVQGSICIARVRAFEILQRWYVSHLYLCEIMSCRLRSQFLSHIVGIKHAYLRLLRSNTHLCSPEFEIYSALQNAASSVESGIASDDEKLESVDTTRIQDEIFRTPCDQSNHSLGQPSRRSLPHDHRGREQFGTLANASITSPDVQQENSVTEMMLPMNDLLSLQSIADDLRKRRVRCVSTDDGQTPVNADIVQTSEQHIEGKYFRIVATEIGVNRRRVREDVAHVKVQLRFRQLRRERDALRSQLEALMEENRILAASADEARTHYLSLGHDHAVLHVTYHLAVETIEKFEQALKAATSLCDDGIASAIDKLDILEKQHRVVLEDNELLRHRKERACKSIAQSKAVLLEVPQRIECAEKKSDVTLYILTGLAAIALVSFCFKFGG